MTHMNIDERPTQRLLYSHPKHKAEPDAGYKKKLNSAVRREQDPERVDVSSDKHNVFLLDAEAC